MITQCEMEIISHQQIARSIYELVVQGELVDHIDSPGQFVHVRVSPSMDPLLRRPISIAKVDQEKKQMTLLYRADGHGTTVLSQRVVGDSVNILGPLGNGFPIEATAPKEKAYLIGGGIGVPPLYELSRQLVAKGVEVVHILGFETDEVVFYEEEFRALGDTHIATVDGSKGTQGFVTAIMEELGDDFNTFYSCGPMPMLKAVQDTYTHKKGFISFEERMGCGIGACFACVKETKDQSGKGYIKICSDGPVFEAGVVSI